MRLLELTRGDSKKHTYIDIINDVA